MATDAERTAHRVQGNPAHDVHLHHTADFPETLPPHREYELLVDTLDEKTFIPAVGTVGFDHCTGHAPDCVFGEYCPCLEYWNKNDPGEMPRTPPDGDDRPF